MSNTYFPINSKVIFSGEITFIGTVVSEAEHVTFCEFGSYQGYYQYSVKKANGEVVKCISTSLSFLKRTNQRYNNLFQLKNLFNINHCYV